MLLMSCGHGNTGCRLKIVVSAGWREERCVLAVWYDGQGPAEEVLQVGELPDLFRAQARSGCEPPFQG